MSIKDLFDKGKTFKILRDKSQQDLLEDLESPRFIDAYNDKQQRFIPDTDFTSASNFARFGLAEEYYREAIERIYTTYPYDGSLAERTEWENQSGYLDLFIFENEYPRTNGFVNINPTTSSYTGAGTNNVHNSTAPEWIYVKGGPHADPNSDFKSDFSAGPDGVGVSKANIYHTGSRRTNNLELDFTKGVTTEFWMKKDGFHASTAAVEVIFSNQVINSHLNTSYYSVQVKNDAQTKINLAAVSGTKGSSTTALFTLDSGLTTIADGNWHHYAVTAKTKNSQTEANLYVDGVHTDRQVDSDALGAVTGTMVAGIAALPAAIDSNYGAGWGNIISASFDEFRYWKVERNAQEIGRNWRTQVNGGTNTDNSKYDDRLNTVDLGVYFKFNEGIVGNSTTDSTVLDYSGRISNGSFNNYSTSHSRETGSAIVLSGLEATEFRDPIIYSSHPDVASLLASKVASGSLHDTQNFNSMYKSLPGWILEEDEKSSLQLKNLTQILSSYFDDLYLQIEKLPTLKDINYPYDNSYEKPLPFAQRLLSSRGFEMPELFADASALAKYLERDEKKLFEKKLYEVKNIIYQNIYNNLIHLQKTKGTFKSLRNFLRCFGVDEDLIKINLYAKDDVYELKENTSNISIKKKYADFDDSETRLAAQNNTTNSYTATVYQYYDPDDSESISYIPALGAPGNQNARISGSFTLEAEVIFPKLSTRETAANQEISLFGLHNVIASNTDLAFISASSGDNASFNIVATKQSNNASDVKFSIKGYDSFLTDLETDSAYVNVYDNEKWNFAFRLRPTKYPVKPHVSGYYEPAASAYTYELYGVNYLAGVQKNEFTINGTMSAADALKFFIRPKRVFVGANRVDFEDALIRQSDVKVSSVRYWFDYIPNETIKAHAKDASNFGTTNPFEGATSLVTGSIFQPQTETLGFHWTYENVTGSNASGQFLVKDISSGSAEVRAKRAYGTLSAFTGYKYTGRGSHFVSDVGYRNQAVDVEFIPSAKQKLPEVVNSDDMIKILNKQDDVVFTRETTYVQHIISIEKSMYQVISDEMIRRFATIVDFNNLIGEPVNRYRPNYKRLEKLRDLFFEDIENDPDLEKFLEYYKWIDDAVTVMIAKLLPASSNVPDMLRNMVESHVLERSKYHFKFPTLEEKTIEPMSSLKNHLTNPSSKLTSYSKDTLSNRNNLSDAALIISKIGYDGARPHPPESPIPQNKGANWWKYKAERSLADITSGDADVDNNRETIRQRISRVVSGSTATLTQKDGTRYAASTQYNDASTPFLNYSAQKTNTLKGGSNPVEKNKYDYYKGVIRWNDSNRGIDLDFSSQKTFVDFNFAAIPDQLEEKKVFLNTEVRTSLITPFALHSSSVNTGYQGSFSSHIGVDFTALHEDKYGNESERPMQGPFTELHVGGAQHRHIKLNQGSDSSTSRAEGWFLKRETNTSYKLIHPAASDTSLPYATMTRDQLAKRPVNIRNIHMTGNTPTIAGNFLNRYEYVSTVSPEANDPFFVKNVDSLNSHVPEMYKSIMYEDLIGTQPGFNRATYGYRQFRLLDRSYIAGTTKNKTRIRSKFSSPGDIETTSRGFLDPAHETFAVGSTVNFRNSSARTIFNTQMQAHQGQFGVSTHGAGSTSARVFGLSMREKLGSVNKINYIVGVDGAAKHKIHRNNIERLELSGSASDISSMAAVTASSFDNAFVSHMIPRTDNQTRWITASLI
tara:strand:+ start:5102 stop:10222 length:5121 start_codon:yes stop_codon:yes gene_type:complete